MPCVISASTLFCVETRGVESMRPLPCCSSAVSATSRLNAPLIEPSARPTALRRAPDAEVDRRRLPPRRRPARRRCARRALPLFGNASGRRVAERRVDSAVEAPLHAERAREVACSSGRCALRSRPAAAARRACDQRRGARRARSGRSVMISVLVRASTCDRAALRQRARRRAAACSSSALRVAERPRQHAQLAGERLLVGELAALRSPRRPAPSSGAMRTIVPSTM